MAANKETIFQKAPSNGTPVTFVNADGTAEKTIFTAGGEGALVDRVLVTSDDTSIVVLNVFVNDGSTSFRIGTISVPIDAGTNGTIVGVNLLDTTQMPGLQASGGLSLATTHLLKVAPQAAVTAAKTVTLTPLGGDY